MAQLDFIKMQGTGNDFVILDARQGDIDLTADLVRALSDRHFGIGCDLLCRIAPGPDGTDAALRFFNADGSEAGACGNATRCVARLLSGDTPQDRYVFETGFGRLTALSAGEGQFSVNMGQPELRWDHIPLAEAADVKALPIAGAPSAVSMGNPHMVFLVENAEAADVAGRGPVLEHHPLYPERTNVEFCSLNADGSVRMRVWERGVGITLACGSGACASVVALTRLGHLDGQVTVHLDGGPLLIDWRADGVWMTGPAKEVFRGQIDPEALTA